MTPVLAVGNQKGGVGKTTISLGLASAARHAGGRVLVVDLDPQANSTDVLGPDSTAPGALSLLADPRGGGGGTLADAVTKTRWEGIDLIPADDALAAVDTDTAPTQPLRLRRALAAGAATVADYDVLILDCPPSLGRLLFAGLTAATDLLIVTEPGAHALRGVTRVEETAAEVRDGFGQDTPRIAGILLNRTRRTVEHAWREQELREAYGELVLPGGVPERIAVSDAAGRGQPIHQHGGDGAAAVTAALDLAWTALTGRLQAANAPTTSRKPR